jgi:hypothetical protein
MPVSDSFRCLIRQPLRFDYFGLLAESGTFRDHCVLPPRHDGQNTCSVFQKRRVLSTPPRKNILLLKIEKQAYNSPVPRSLTRAYRDRHDTWCGMRWTRAVRQTNAPRAYGQAVWSCPLDAGVKFADDESAGDGGYQARDTGEITEQPFQPLRRECRSDFGVPVLACVRLFCFARKAVGAACTRHSLPPLFFQGVTTGKARTNSRRGNEESCLPI